MNPAPGAAICCAAYARGAYEAARCSVVRDIAPRRLRRAAKHPRLAAAAAGFRRPGYPPPGAPMRIATYPARLRGLVGAASRENVRFATRARASGRGVAQSAAPPSAAFRQLSASQVCALPATSVGCKSARRPFARDSARGDSVAPRAGPTYCGPPCLRLIPRGSTP